VSIKNRYQEKWQEHYRLLLKYVEREGHSRVPARYKEDGFALGRWVQIQRDKRSRMSDERRAALEEIEDWNWKGQDAKWQKGYDTLCQFVEREGHAYVPKLYTEDGYALGVWVMHQRIRYRDKKLSHERAQALEQVPGWDWFPRKGIRSDRLSSNRLADTISSSAPLPRLIADASLDELAEEIWNLLFGIGIVSLRAAISIVAAGLYEKGIIRKRKANLGSTIGDILYEAVKLAVEYDYLESPRPDYYRAVLRDAEDYELEDWRMCLFNAIENESVGREEAIRMAAEWAKQNTGLEYSRLGKKSLIWRRLEETIDEAIKNKEIKQTVFYGVVRIQVV
jgi:hypothetical protein